MDDTEKFLEMHTIGNHNDHYRLLRLCRKYREALEIAKKEIHGEFCTGKSHFENCLKIQKALAYTGIEDEK